MNQGFLTQAWSLTYFSLLQECLGIWDNQEWLTNYLPYMNLPPRVKKVFMVNHPKSGPGDVGRWVQHARITTELAKLITDSGIYRMIILLTLTKKPGNGPGCGEMNQLHLMYQSTIQRHLKSRSRGKAQLLGSAMVKPTEVVDCLASIDLLARLHMEMISQLS